MNKNRIEKLIGVEGTQLPEERAGICTAIVNGKEYKTKELSDDIFGVYNCGRRRIYVAWSDVLMLIRENIKYINTIEEYEYRLQTGYTDFSRNDYIYDNVLGLSITLTSDTFLLTEYSKYYSQLSAFAHPVEYYIYKFLTSYNDIEGEEHKRVLDDNIRVFDMPDNKVGYLKKNNLIYVKDKTSYFQLYKCPLYIDKKGNLYLAISNDNDFNYKFIRYKILDLKKFTSDLAKIKLIYGCNNI